MLAEMPVIGVIATITHTEEGAAGGGVADGITNSPTDTNWSKLQEAVKAEEPGVLQSRGPQNWA